MGYPSNITDRLLGETGTPYTLDQLRSFAADGRVPGITVAERDANREAMVRLGLFPETPAA